MKKEWWHGKVAYQIYPKSFKDSNGDGIGDLRGIIEKLDYLKELGVDIIWLSPIYRSPFVDQGYDISDYYQIDPAFGTMEDMMELLREAKKRDMHILMDLVVNHCSDQHEWFQKALADPDGEYGKYFYIREGKDNGEPPCNWRSYFGGSVWEKIPNTDNKYYLHMFAKEQPDLNWENPVVREKIYEMMNWWLERGLSGFRIDAIINIKKDLRFQDFPADRDDGMCSPRFMLEAANGVGDFLTEMRDATFRKHDAFAVAEAFNIHDGEMPLFVGDNGYFSSIFDFSTETLNQSDKGWYSSSLPTVNQVRNAFYQSQAAMGNHGFFCNIVENHDEPRGASRYLPPEGQNDYGKKLLALTMFMRRGLPFLYQGQEIGMTNCPFDSIDEIDDISTIDQYYTALDAGVSQGKALEIIRLHSRDNARTPVQWDDTENAGFTTGTPWMKVNPNYKEVNAKAQEENPDSVLNFYRSLAALRKDPAYRETIVYGSFEPILTEEANLYAFYRNLYEQDCPENEVPYIPDIPESSAPAENIPGIRQSLLVLANCQDKTLTITLPKEGYDIVLLNNYKGVHKADRMITLRPFQAVILL